MWQIMARMTHLEAAKCQKLKNATTPYFARTTQKWDQCIFNGNICFAKSLTQNISVTMGDIGLVSKDYIPIGILRLQWSRD